MKKYSLIVISCIWYVITSFQISADSSTSLDKLTYTLHPDTSKYYTSEIIELKQGENLHISLNQQYTAIKITSLDTLACHIDLNAGSEHFSFGTMVIDGNIDIPPSFVIFQSPKTTLSIKASQAISCKLELFNAPPISENISVLKNKKSNCQKPQMISQSVWRSGLPAPLPGRLSTKVKHCIIHHSAGSNTDTNYINTIRNIYLYHTQSNGWDDIGYNYLIAPDGTIFNGRDALSLTDEDNIQGAHFCAKNGGTMGICLLGNYNLVSPGTPLVESLTSLLSWKLHKENLSAFDGFPHPNSSGDTLPTITMHRTGCPTACPGDSMAYLLDDVRLSVQNDIDRCGDIVSTPVISEKYKCLIYPNPSNGKFYAMVDKAAKPTHYAIKNTEGKYLIAKPLPTNGLIKTSLPSGFYYIDIMRDKVKIISKKIIIK